MKKLSLLGFMVLFTAVITCAQQNYPDKLPGRAAIPSGCTVITFSKGDSVFFGGNDDYINPDSYYWVDPGDSSRYGVIWIGTPDNPQQGVNEKFLAYDANGLPRVDVNPHSERTPVPGEYHNYCMQIMHECSTVEEVITWVNDHQRPPYIHDQLHFADATGDAVIISAGKDGEVVFSRKAPGDGFLVSTNFNVANPSNGYSYPCWRYDLARDVMGQLLEKEIPLSHHDITDVMEAVHLEKGGSWTIETMVADLVQGKVYLYYFYQFDRPVELDVRNELADPRDPGPLSKLFPEDVQQEAAKRYNREQATKTINQVTGAAWPALVVISLILLFLLFPGNKKGLRFWIPAMVVFGPIALIIRFVIYDKCKSAYCRTVLLETLGDLSPVVISYTLALVILVVQMLSDSPPWYFQVAAMFGLPIIIGSFFHAAFLAPLSKLNFGKLLLKLLPRVIVTTFLGLGGIIPVAMPLVNKSLYMGLLQPLSPLAVTTWWAIIVIGSLLGGTFIFLFEGWEVKRGFRSWTLLTEREGDFSIPAWVKLWWWILVSIIILLAGMTAGIILSK